LKVAVIFHRFGPYHCARLEAAAQRCDVTAIELASETGEYQWAKICGANGYTRVTLFPESDGREASAVELEMRLSRALNGCRPDAVAIPGWSDKGAFAALRWCAQNDTPAILMSESTAHDEPRVWWKESVKRRIVGLYSTALVGGRLHADYLEQLGMSRDRILTGYDVVDNTHFAIGSRQQPSSTPHPFPLPGRGGEGEPFFLASARFIPKKNLFTLLRAYSDYRAAAGASDWKLVLLGDGPLRSALNSQLSTLNLQDSVLLPGFKQYDELPEYYARANAFVHVSTSEQWGLVVNEAIAAGLPVVVSNRCGCVPELVHEGANGFTFDPDDQKQLAKLLARISSMSPAERAQFGQCSSQIASRFPPDRFGKELLSAAEAALKLPRTRLNVLERLLLCSLMHQ
jgi:glycosyltransferase involved in cell wall biosynthesis